MKLAARTALWSLLLAAVLDLHAPERIRALQHRLAELGFDPGKVDGVLGPATRDALGRYQSARGLPATCEPDADTAAALGLARRGDLSLGR